jgi:hypothetical protein
MTFDRVAARGDWKPIPNCPGRFVLAGGPTARSPIELLGTDALLSEHRVPAARDLVIVAPLDRGGLISYQRANGMFVHTLNTPEGFARKLAQLAISR